MKVKQLLRVIPRLVIKKGLGSFLAQKAYHNELIPRVKKYPKQKVTQDIKNILQVTTHNWGGASRVAFRLHYAFQKMGYKSQVLVQKLYSPEPGTQELGIPRTIKQKLLFYGEEAKGWENFFPLSTFGLKDLTSYQNANIVHLHNIHGWYFSIFALPELTAFKPTVWTLHDMHAITGHCANSFDCTRWTTGCGECPDLSIYPPLPKDTSAFLWETKKKIYANSTLTIVCPSLWLKKKVENSILQHQDIRLIYNGIDQSVFKKSDKNLSRKDLGLPLDKTILLFSAASGIENPWKGGSYILDLYKLFAERKDLLFLNVGGEKTSYKDTNWLDYAYVSDEREMAKIYAASDLLLYPSLADNCPLVVLEALSCGLPVIAFETGGIPELVSHLNTGYIAGYKDGADFIKGLSLFLEDRDLRSRAGQAAYESSLHKFSLEKMTEEYLKVYSDTVRKYESSEAFER